MDWPQSLFLLWSYPEDQRKDPIFLCMNSEGTLWVVGYTLAFPQFWSSKDTSKSSSCYISIVIPIK